MFNRVCQHVWNCEFDEDVHRWYTCGDNFGYNNRRCFFLVDYGTSANDDGVPVLCYDWTGETLYVIPTCDWSCTIMVDTDNLLQQPSAPASPI